MLVLKLIYVHTCVHVYKPQLYLRSYAIFLHQIIHCDTVITRAYMMIPLFAMYIPQVIDEVDKDGKTPLMWAALRVFKYVCTVIRVCLYSY